ncbi:MAG: ATP-binding cassette domain-containing protein [Nitrososphaeraceae archaeon]|nr:ATP-binding cassette domain-containing protein [Nitrososphaeraceae archaeon]MDW0180587.1 ATP-binding cassette domain-containing protein [Nitrososphaeraceae archaeon]MDW0181475.1 ATP-binding cassette domain-containing protein [Nitrososphaeraceae archaeon]MDW0190112.1 ATP-binding cassette domain-containing protein [Nitrososphaeraceae archaeon]MDW0197410.1 ATP-binding cassette domain-containing protein [Nitrososphaeraceae archaeon]
MIIVKNLVKKYGDFYALNGLSFEVNENEIFGLLGPNGAGKTTLIHILATLLRPTTGGAVVNGYDVLHNATKVRESIGVVFQAPSSDDILTGYENLKIHALLYGIPRGTREKRISEVLKLVGLEGRKNDQVKKYSGGMRRRLEIARGLLHHPKVLFLDEPTLGLDPQSRESMWTYIKEIVTEEKVTIILTTHYMEEADMLCDRIGFISNGKIIALNSPSNLKQEMGGDIVKINFIGDIPSTETFTRFDFVHKVDLEENTAIVYMDEVNSNIHSLIKDLKGVRTIEYKKPTLNDVFLRLSGDFLSGDSPEGGFMQRYAQYKKS